MSKQNNVNPDHYKTRGRERPGKDVVTDVLKQNYSEAKSREARRDLNNTGFVVTRPREKAKTLVSGRFPRNG